MQIQEVVETYPWDTNREHVAYILVNGVCFRAFKSTLISPETAARYQQMRAEGEPFSDEECRPSLTVVYRPAAPARPRL